MDREEWLEWRKQGIGASDATIIMGKAPRSWEINSPYKLWLHKMGKLENTETPAMRMGNEFEGEALNWFENRIETLMFSQEVFTHPNLPWMRATFDGISHDHSISVEIKLTSRKNFEEVSQGRIPPVFKAQLIHQMEVKPTKHHFLCVYDRHTKEGAFVEVKKDDDHLEELMAKEMAFEKCLREKTPPQFTHFDMVTVDDNNSWLTQAEIVAQAQEDMKKKEEVFKEAKRIYEMEKDRLVEIAHGETSKCGNYELMRVKRPGSINYAKIPALQEVDLEPFRSSPSIFYRFSVKNP